MKERNVNPVPRPDSSSDDLQASPRTLSQWLIHHAACRTPPDLSERLEEEWRADLAARPSASSRLRFAIGCCWATRVITREHSSVRISLAGAAAGSKGTLGFTRDETGIFARRSFTFFLVAGLHIALFYALMTGLAFNIIKEMPKSLTTRILPEPQRHPLPLPAPQLTKPVIEIPPPYFPPTNSPVEAGDIVREPTDIPTSRSETSPQIPSHDMIRLAGGPGSGFPNADDYYPSVAKRMEEQGVTTVRVCVGANGRLTSDPTIAQTSGSPRLDGGALLLAKAGSGHYRPATEDGQAVNSCYSFRVRFTLRTDR